VPSLRRNASKTSQLFQIHSEQCAALKTHVLHWAAGATSQDFEIPVTPKLAAKIEKDLLEKNQHLTQVQLVVQTSQ
jgi:hypothetical protein